MKKINIVDLERILDKGEITDNLKNAISILLAAMNDWPNSLNSLEDFEYEVQDYIKGETKKINIEKKLKSNIDFNKYAWEAESLSQLLEVYDYYKEDLSVKEIILLLRMELLKEV
jgi:hypothetical protein